MAEIKKFWIVSTPSGQKDLDWLWTDPAVRDDEDRLAQFCGGLGEGGYDLDKFLRVMQGTVLMGGRKLWEEKTKIFDDEASARKEAEKRLAQAKKSYEGRKTASRVVDRFKTR